MTYGQDLDLKLEKNIEKADLRIYLKKIEIL